MRTDAIPLALNSYLNFPAWFFLNKINKYINKETNINVIPFLCDLHGFAER